MSAVVLVAALMFPATGAMALAGAAPLQPAAGQYFPVTPVHALDTRDGTGGVPAQPLAAQSSVTFPVTGIGGVPAVGVSDVYVVLNAIGPTTQGCLDDFNPDAGDTGICSATFDAGNNDTDSDIVQVSASGYISVRNGSSGTVDAVVTVMGYFTDGSHVSPGDAAGDTYVPLPLDHIVATQSGLGAPKAQIPAGGTLTVQVTGLDGVPSDAAGAALYIGAKYGTTTGSVSAYPAGGSPSSLSLLSYVPSHAVHDLYIGALSSTGQLTLWNHSSGPVDLQVAIQGYLVSPTGSETGSTYQDVPQYRLADTRNGTGGVQSTAVQAGQSITFTATGVDDIPQSGVSAVAETVVAINPAATGFLSEYAAGTPDPGEPGVNFYAAGNQGSGLTAALVSSVSPTGQQTITNHSTGTVDIAVTVRGYFAAATAPGAPQSVNTTVSGSTATVTWQVPYRDGGAAITGYVVSAPPDTATVTVDGNTYHATLTGLTSPSADNYTVTAKNAAGSSVGADEISGDGTEVDNQEVSVSASSTTSTGSVALVDDSATQAVTAHGVTTTTALTPDVSNLTDDAAASARSGAKCTPKQNDKAVQDGVPYYMGSFNNRKQTSYYTISWLNHLFGVRNAYIDPQTGQEQFEVIGCTSGGAVDTSTNPSLAFLSENALTASSTSSQATQNWEYASKVTKQSTITKTMGFQLGGSFHGVSASINSSESVSFTLANAELSGSPGRDNQFGSLYNAPAKYDPTRFNYRWNADNSDGLSADFVGNVGEIQWQFPMGSNPQFWSNAVIGICNLSNGACGKHGN